MPRRCQAVVLVGSGSSFCPASFTLDVGQRLDCQTEIDGNCSIYVTSSDVAGNDADNTSRNKYLNIDLTPPSVQ